MAKARKSKGPKVGSLAWEKQLPKNPVYVRNTIDELARRASQGNKRAAASLAAWLERHPDLKPTVRELDDLRTQTESAWVKALAGTDLALERVIRDEVARMTAELLGENPSVLDRALVSNVVVAHLANARATMWAAHGGRKCPRSPRPGSGGSRARPGDSSWRSRVWPWCGGRRAADWPHPRSSSCSRRPPDGVPLE